MPARALADPVAVAERLGRLREPHVAPLTAYVERLREECGDRVVPWIDPVDGGVGARVLLLLEAPGPRALGPESPRRSIRGSGFVSAETDDLTAKNLFVLRREAGLLPSQCVLWNVVPWYVGDHERIRAATAEDLRAGVGWLHELLGLLAAVRVVVLMGRKAQRGWDLYAGQHSPTVPTLSCPHPSQRVLNRPGTREAIVATLRAAGAAVSAVREEPSRVS